MKTRFTNKTQHPIECMAFEWLDNLDIRDVYHAAPQIITFRRLRKWHKALASDGMIKPGEVYYRARLEFEGQPFTFRAKIGNHALMVRIGLYE